MIQTGFHIGDRDWWVMATIGIQGEEDLDEVYKALAASGSPEDEARKACRVLSRKNSGYTFSHLDGHFTLLFASAATSADELYDTIAHEVKHAVEHISNYYGVDPKSEQAAYLQGELSKQLFPAIALAVCPKCSHSE